VIDAYTRRILERHQLAPASASYEQIRELFEQSLRPLAEEFLERAHSPLPSTTAPGPSGSSHSPSRMSTAKHTALVQIFNEMHALIVGVGKNYCKRSQAECERCPLQRFLPGAQY
jgi:endonuclease-3 related protein